MTPYQRRDYHRNNNFLIPCVICVDFLLLGGVVVLWYFMTFWESDNVFHINTPYVPCVDQVHYSYPKDPDGGLLPDTVVYVLGFALPAIVVLFGEAILAIYQIQGGRHYAVHEREIRVCQLRFHPVLRRSVRYIGTFTLCGFLALIMVRFGQLVTGLPKPNYFASCDGPAACTDPLELVKLECTEDGVRESFPSMHAAFSAYSSLFAGIYICILLQPLKTVRAVRPLVCFSVMSIPYMVGLERITFYEAHWVDVIAGWVLGSLNALYVVYFILNKFQGVEVVARGRGGGGTLSASPSFRDTVITNQYRPTTLENGVRRNGSSANDGTYKEQQFRAVLTRNRPPSTEGDFYAYRYIYSGSQGQASRRERTGTLPTVPETPSNHVYHNATGHNTIGHDDPSVRNSGGRHNSSSGVRH